MTVAQYTAHPAAYNLTFQYAVAASLSGAVLPPQVTRITVVADASVPASRRLTNLRADAAAAADACVVTYRVTLYDAQLSFDELKAMFVDTAASGQMNAHLRDFAALFGVSTLEDVDVTTLAVNRADDDHDGSKKLTTAQIVGIAIGAFMFCVLAALAVWFAYRSTTKAVAGTDIQDATSQKALTSAEPDQQT
jgi:hypothetical protein